LKTALEDTMENEAKEARPRRRAASTPPEQPHGALESLGNVDVSQALSTVSDYAKENPHVALAAAAGVGFILGRGLTPRMLGGIALFVGRRYASVAMRDALAGAVTSRLGQEG